MLWEELYLTFHCAVQVWCVSGEGGRVPVAIKVTQVASNENSNSYLGAWVAGHGVDRAAPARHPSSTLPSNHSHQMPNWLSRPFSHFSLCFLTCSKLNIKPFSHHSLCPIFSSCKASHRFIRTKPSLIRFNFQILFLPRNFFTFSEITACCETDQLD